MIRILTAFALLAGCLESEPPIEYTGEVRRFAVDVVAVPMNNTEARGYATDVNGDGTIDNQLGAAIGALASFAQDVTAHGPDMIASGVLASSAEIIADDFENDPTVAIRYMGADGDEVELVGGELVDGRFKPKTPGTATAHLPIFIDADPSVVKLQGAQIFLVTDGNGGFDGRVGGGVLAPEALAAAHASVLQMFESHPSDHVAFFRMLDTNPQDFMITQHEFETDSLISSLLAPDLEIESRPALSIGFRVHLSPCPEGRCATAPPADRCFDRVLDGDETDVDCGGSCGACAGGSTCAIATDCETAACDGGTCAAPSCSNGVKDGLETDVDCGSQCGDCAISKLCWSGSDCASGRCGPSCTGFLCGSWTFDRCQ